MNLDFFTSNINNPSVFIKAMKEECKANFDWKTFKQYDPMWHDIVRNKSKRKDKKIMIPDISGATNDAGEPLLMPQTVYVARLPIGYQRLIVSRQSAFLTGGKVEIKAKPQNSAEQKLYEVVKETWRKNKLQFKNSAIAKAFYSETECAEIWYSKKNNDGTVSMKCKIYSPSQGYDLVPAFDPFGDLIAFGLGYESASDKGTKIKHMDVYTVDKLLRHTSESGEWKLVESIDLLYGKIPVIYYNLERAIWSDVQIMIERLETLVSNFADTNDYNGSPILAARGEIRGFSAKGETGKVIELVGEDADLKYVNWDSLPEAIKLEKEMLVDFIFTITQTPNISFSEMKGLGDISGAAFDRMMIDGHLKATDMQNGMYGECIQRRLNFMCYACAETGVGMESAKDMEISAEFSLFSIDDERERIDNAMAANGGKPIIDWESSIGMAQLTDDPKATYETLQKQSVINNPNVIEVV